MYLNIASLPGKKLSHYDFVEKTAKYLLLLGVIKLSSDLFNHDSSNNHLAIKVEMRSSCKLCYKSGERTTSYYKCVNCAIFFCIYLCFHRCHVPSFNYGVDESRESRNKRLLKYILIFVLSFA